jgi:hypothetical protein
MSAWCHMATYAAQQTCSLIDHLVGPGDQHRGRLKAERLGGFEVGGKFDRPLDRKVSRLGPFRMRSTK